MGYKANLKWRLSHPEMRQAAKKRNYDKSNKSNGTAWEQWEIDLILKHGIPDRELSDKITRSVLAIQVKRSRLKNKV